MNILQMLQKKLLIIGSISMLSLLMSINAYSFPGTLATEPLVTSTQAQPNVMLVIDGSESMDAILPGAPFDPDVTYYNCPSNLRLNNNATIYLKMSGGKPSINVGGFLFFGFIIGGQNYVWGTTPTSSGTPSRCFNNNLSYNAILRVGSYSAEPYNGNYMNWYWGSSPKTWGFSAKQKPGQLTRLATVKQAMNATIPSFSNMRVGLASYNSSIGTRVLVGVDDIAVNSAKLINGINGLSGDGGSPHSNALRDIGRYFVEGYNQSLTLHPGKNNQSSASAYSVYENKLSYSSNVTRKSPIEYFCQKNFIIWLTDGSSVSDTNIQNNIYLRDYDGDCQNNSSCSSYDRKPDRVYSSSGSDYADDVASSLFDIDLRPDLDDPDGNEVHNNVITNVIGFVPNDFPAIPNMQDVAEAGGGVFELADSASKLFKVLEEAAANIAALVATSTSVTFSLSNFSTTEYIYRAQYSTDDWTGDLIKSSLTSAGEIGTTQWSFAKILDGLNFENRYLFTYNEETDQAVLFKTLSSLSQKQQDDLTASPGGGVDSLGQARIDYLRGDDSKAGSDFRERSTRLNDTVHSSPILVAQGQNRWPDIAPFPSADGSTYSDFQASIVNRTPVVYFATNGGVLTAVNANNGDELFGYYPNYLFSNNQQSGYHYLTDPTYQHRYMIDLPSAVSDAYVASRAGGEQWRTILISGARGGGQGYTTLDITDPTLFNPGNENKIFMWEFTSNDDPNLGYTYAIPSIVLMENGRWAAIFGNGYNNEGTGSAQLFIVFLDGGLDGSWTLGTDYIVIDTKSGDLTNKNGLGSVAAVDVNGNGAVDRIYAGDLVDGIWAFDVSSDSAGDWDVAYKTGSTPIPLVYTHSGSTHMQITAAPIVVKHPTVVNDTSNAPNTMVFFGTGQYLTNNDPANTDPQRLFGVWDRGEGGLTTSKLVQQSLTTIGNIRLASNNIVDYDATGNSRDYGWYINLTGGERSVLTPALGDDVVIFTTTIPDSSSICASGGSSWLIALSTNGGVPEQVILDVNDDGKFDSNDNYNQTIVSGVFLPFGIPAQPTFHGDYVYVPLSSGAIEKIKVSSQSIQEGRISWQELTGD